MTENEISILIVEDEALIAQNIKMQLENFGYSIAGVCYKYNTALKAISETQYDVVITDINLGNGIDEKSGLQIAQQVKLIKNCPIIFLTAFSDKDTVKKATALAPSAYLVKPVNAANLFATVQLAVDNFATKTTAVTDGTETPDYFFVKNGAKLIKVFWKDVYHLEAVKNYVKIKTNEYNSGLLLRGSLQNVLQNRMSAVVRASFIKITRAEVLAKNIIKETGKGTITTNFGVFKTSADFKLDDIK
ncbi:response regulator [Ferruginibacter sp.]|nr:response regulator [Ferruginibacter sp.]